MNFTNPECLFNPTIIDPKLNPKSMKTRVYYVQVIWTRRNHTTLSRADQKERVFHDCCRGGGDLALCAIEVEFPSYDVPEDFLFLS